MCVNNLSKVALDSEAAGIEPAISSRKSNALTTAPPSHTFTFYRHNCGTDVFSLVTFWMPSASSVCRWCRLTWQLHSSSTAAHSVTATYPTCTVQLATCSRWWPSEFYSVYLCLARPILCHTSSSSSNAAVHAKCVYDQHSLTYFMNSVTRPTFH